MVDSHQGLYYPLKTAAATLQCSVDDLIFYALAGKLEICTHVSSNILWERPREQVFDQISALEKAGIAYITQQEGENKYVSNCVLTSDYGSFDIQIVNKAIKRINAFAMALLAIHENVFALFKNVENLLNKEDVHLKTGIFNLPQGCMFRDALGNELEGREKNTSIRTNTFVDIPFLSLVITEQEFQRFEKENKQIEAVLLTSDLLLPQAHEVNLSAKTQKQPQRAGRPSSDFEDSVFAQICLDAAQQVKVRLPLVGLEPLSKKLSEALKANYGTIYGYRIIRDYLKEKGVKPGRRGKPSPHFNLPSLPSITENPE